MKNVIYPVLLILLVCCGSEEDEPMLSTTPPEVPEMVTHDLNNDGVDDLATEYAMGQWDGVGSSGFFFTGRFRPLNGGSILFDMNIDFGSSTTYHKKDDVITKDVNTPLEWISFPAHLVDIANTAEGTWPNEWTISNNKIQDFYYIGIKIQSAKGDRIGWLKFTINSKSGAIKIVDKELTFLDSIAISR
jgi:hypothetical protein